MNVTKSVDELTNIVIGYSGENIVESVTFDFSEWKTAYGEGVLSLHIQRPMDSTLYPVLLEVDGTEATWTISATDTAQEGHGEGQLVYTVGNAVKKSKVFGITVRRSLTVGEAPDGFETWLDQLEQLAQETVANAQTASEKADEANTSASDASESAENSENSARESESSAQESEAWAVGQKNGTDVEESDITYQNNSKYYAEQSALSAQTATTKALEASRSAQSASEVATQVTEDKNATKTYRDDAEGFKATAVEKANEATQAASDAKSYRDQSAQILQDVQTEGNAQIEAIQNEGSDQITAVQNKGEEVLDSIPQDYTALIDEVADLKDEFNTLGLSVVEGKLCVTYAS